MRKDIDDTVRFPVIFKTILIWHLDITGYCVHFHAKGAAERFLTLGVYFLSLVLVAAYTAILASDVSIVRSKSIVSGIDGINDGKIPYSRIGTTVEEFYLREISDGNRNNYPIKSEQEIDESLLNDIIDVYFMDTGSAEYVTNTIYFNLIVAIADFEKGVFGVVLPKSLM